MLFYNVYVMIFEENTLELRVDANGAYNYETANVVLQDLDALSCTFP